MKKLIARIRRVFRHVPSASELPEQSNDGPAKAASDLTDYFSRHLSGRIPTFEVAYDQALECYSAEMDPILFNNLVCAVKPEWLLYISSCNQSQESYRVALRITPSLYLWSNEYLAKTREIPYVRRKFSYTLDDRHGNLMIVRRFNWENYPY